MFRNAIILLCIFISGMTNAQMPHEVLVLANKNSQASLLVANTFVAVRQIPKRNIVYLDIPESAYGGTATVTPEEFTQLIWEPANAVVKERGLEDQLLAWVYSVDFPIRVRTDPSDRKQMSVGGLTFLRNEVPDLGMVQDGTYLSKLFAGPNQRLKLNLPGISLGMHKNGLGRDATVPPEVAYLHDGLRDRMPLPSMMLGYIGEKGNDVQTVLDTMARGWQSDFRGQRAGIYFVQTDDVRSKCREYQFYPSVNELSQYGIMASVVTNLPAGAENVMGVMMGAENVDPSRIESFAPGAMAEHLTSWSAEFQKRQTKMTDWLKAGATVSAGSVVEPFALADKFPSARFFVHYGLGCTALESFYQSIACPLQILLLGDPLAKPYALPVEVRLVGAQRIDRNFTYMASARCREPNAQFLYSFLLDGREMQGASEDNGFQLKVEKLSDGWHEIRAVARIRHLVQHAALIDKPIMVDRMGRSIEILPDSERLGTYEHGLKVKIGGEEPPKKLRLVCGELVLDEKDYSLDATLVLSELVIGEGPNRVRAIAIYEDGMEVSSEPVNFKVEFTAIPPSSVK